MLQVEGNKTADRFTIIDICIIAVILSIVAGIGYEYYMKKVLPSVKQENLIIRFKADEVPEYVAKAVQKGDQVVDAKKNIALGKIVDIKIDQPFSIGVNEQGQQVKAAKPGMVSATVAVEGAGKMDEQGLLTHNNSYRIGDELTVYAGKAQFEKMPIIGIDPE